MAVPTGPIDRQTTAPFHLKLFYKTGGFHALSDFPIPSSSTSTSTSHLPPHLQIYTWPTLSLREASHLLVSALPSLLPSPAIGTRLAFRLVYPSPDNGAPRYLAKEIGSVVVSPDDEEEGDRGEEGVEGGKRGDKGVAKDTTGGDAIVKAGIMAGKLGGDPAKTLAEARFVVGDFLDVAVLPTGRDGEVVPPPREEGGRGRGRGPFGGGHGGRENGFGTHASSGGGEYGRGGYGGGGGGGGGYGTHPPSGGNQGGFGRGGRGGYRGDREGGVPMGEWRRGERLPDTGSRGGGGGGGYRGRGRGRGDYDAW